MPKKVKIVVTAYGGEVPLAQAASIERSVRLMAAEEQWNAAFVFRPGDSILPRARNAEVSDFLADPDCTDLVMIDADTIISPEGLVQLLKFDADVVGAPYRSRSEPFRWASISWLLNDLKLDERGLIEVECMGTGLLRMSRRALQAVWDSEADREYSDAACQTKRSRPVFWFEIKGDALWGEDIAFCRKWRALGGQCYIAPDIRTAHIGKTDFVGHLASWLASQPVDMYVDDAATGTKKIIKNELSSEWGKQDRPSIFLAIPTYGGQLTVPTFLSIIRTIEECHKLDWPLKIECLSGDADLARCRNVLLGSFLKSDATHMLCVDADVSWGEGAVSRLVSHGVAFVCGLYRVRTDEEIYPVHWPIERRMICPENKMPLIAADMVPGGFWLLSRACVETLADKSEKGWVTDKLFPDLKYPWVYDFVYDGNVRRSEDYTFCRKWQEVGGTVWVDPVLCVDHTGLKTFQGNLMAHLAKEMKKVPMLSVDPSAMAARALAMSG